MNKKVGFISLGCAKNLTDTETMIALLSNDGFELTADASEAEIIVVNTCAFIDSAKEESINAILEMAGFKDDKCELLVVTGCLAQRYSEEIAQQLPEADVVLGTTDYVKISGIIKEYYATKQKQYVVGDENTPVSFDLPRVQTTPFYSAYLKIADGCDNFCTYCIIPKLRGKFRSRPTDSVLAEARNLAANGVKELILVAQDTACYGKDINTDLAALLKELGRIDGIEWIRLQYCYPENLSDEIIEEIASNPKVVKYLDMPLQHISDNVLKKMGRRSRQNDIETLIAKLRGRIDNLTIRTSLIVGFPGESEEDFEKLKEFLIKYRINKVGVFTYSREDGTPACEYGGQIDEEIKEQRRDILMTLQQEISRSINIGKTGRMTDIIIEGYDEDELCYVGRCSDDTPDVDGGAYVYSARELEAGEIVTAQIVDASEYDISARVD